MTLYFVQFTGEYFVRQRAGIWTEKSGDRQVDAMRRGERGQKRNPSKT